MSVLLPPHNYSTIFIYQNYASSLEKDDNFSESYSPNINAVTLCSLVLKIYTMQTYFPPEYCKQNSLFKNWIFPKHFVPFQIPDDCKIYKVNMVKAAVAGTG
jgi:hypothetical protein